MLTKQSKTETKGKPSPDMQTKEENPLTAQEASRKRKKKKTKGTDNNAQLISGKIKPKTQIPTTKI
jgi:hypothetical protein